MGASEGGKENGLNSTISQLLFSHGRLTEKSAGKTRARGCVMKFSMLALTLAGLLVTLACTSSTSSNKADQRAAAAACTEPENPYAEDSGHYAGYEWAERNNPGNCGGSSQSFIEGCEEYQRQDEEFEECESKK